MMQIQAERGQTAQALKLYEALRDRLHTELGVNPELETVRVYDALRERRVLLAPQPSVSSPGEVDKRPQASSASMHAASGECTLTS